MESACGDISNVLSHKANHAQEFLKFSSILGDGTFIIALIPLDIGLQPSGVI